MARFIEKSDRVRLIITKAEAGKIARLAGQVEGESLSEAVVRMIFELTNQKMGNNGDGNPV